MALKRIVALVGVVGMLAAACGGGDAESTQAAAVLGAVSTTAAPATTAASTSTEAPTTTAAQATTAAPTTTTTIATTTTLVAASPLEDADGGTPNLTGWVVEPGRYSTDRLGLPIEFTFDDTMTWFDEDGLVTLGRGGISGEQSDVVVVLEPVGIIPADGVGVHPPHDPPVPANTEPLPADLGTWFDAAPQLVVASTGEVDAVDGPARYWDIDLDPGAGETFECHMGNCVANIVHPDWGAFVFGDDMRFRLYQLDGAATGLVVFVQAAAAQFDDTVALSESIVQSMTVAG